MSEPRTIGEVVDYPSLMKVLRERANELHLNRSSDETAKLSGLPDKYMAKLLGPRPVRRIGSKTLGAVLGVLQLKLIAVEDAEAMRLYGHRTDMRDERRVRGGVVTQEFSRRHMQKIGRAGGKARFRLPAKTIRKLARDAARAKHAKRRLAAESFDWETAKKASKTTTIEAPSGVACRAPGENRAVAQAKVPGRLRGPSHGLRSRKRRSGQSRPDRNKRPPPPARPSRPASEAS